MTEKKDLVLNIEGGVKICLPGDLTLMSPYILAEQERWFEDEIAFVGRYLKPGMRVVDIGANYGAYALFMAKFIGETGRLWCYEPAAKTAAYLGRSLEINGFTNTRVIAAALSGHQGAARLSTGENAETNTLNPEGREAGAGEEVTLTTLVHEASASGWKKIDFIKMDAEGEEANIIRGGAEFLECPPGVPSPLVMCELLHGEEVNRAALKEFGRINYRPFRYVPGPGLLVPFEGEKRDGYQLNFFACNEEKVVELEAAGLLAREGQETALEENCFKKWLSQKPYGKGFSQVFSSGGSARPGAEEYLTALDAYAFCVLGEGSAAQRYGALLNSFEALKTIAQTAASPARLFSFIRVAREAGERAAAVHVLAMLKDAVLSGREMPMEEPFLPVSARYDGLSPKGAEKDWVESSVLEEWERLRTHSSYFSRTDTRPLFDRLKAGRFYSPEMERRRQLTAIVEGRQERPGSAEVLVRKGADNLNPDLWRG